jgi:hypothetical protein
VASVVGVGAPARILVNRGLVVPTGHVRSGLLTGDRAVIVAAAEVAAAAAVKEAVVAVTVVAAAAVFVVVVAVFVDCCFFWCRWCWVVCRCC